MTSPKDTPRQIKREVILGASGPCHAYSGTAMAGRTKQGVEFVLMASNSEDLIALARRLLPTDPEPDPAGFYPVSLIHDRHIQREDEEL